MKKKAVKISAMLAMVLATMFLTLLLVFAASCATPSSSGIVSRQCDTDADCVPAACCHARDAVNKAYAPNCQDIICTMVCEPGTLDCGQGELKCLNSQCAVVVKESDS